MIFRGTCSLLFTSLWGPLLAFTIDLYIQVCLCHLLLLPLSFSNMSLAFYVFSSVSSYPCLFLSLSIFISISLILAHPCLFIPLSFLLFMFP